jgi:hypothetical protein
MAIHALWEDRYGLSIRKGPIDLSKLSATVDADANVDVASHNNDGTPTASQMLDGTTQVGGDQHFNARDTTTTGQGRVIGQRISTGSSIVFGMPVIGNPDFSTGQETIEVQKTDGFATQRVGAANEASDIFRAGQKSVDFFRLRRYGQVGSPCGGSLLSEWPQGDFWITPKESCQISQ